MTSGRSFSLLLTLALTAMLWACGNRGSLYLPDETPVEPIRAESRAESMPVDDQDPAQTDEGPAEEEERSDESDDS